MREFQSIRKYIDQTADELSYVSEHCEYIATRGDNLKKHIEAKHLGVTYACN